MRDFGNWTRILADTIQGICLSNYQTPKHSISHKQQYTQDLLDTYVYVFILKLQYLPYFYNNKNYHYYWTREHLNSPQTLSELLSKGPENPI